MVCVGTVVSPALIPSKQIYERHNTLVSDFKPWTNNRICPDTLMEKAASVSHLIRVSDTDSAGRLDPAFPSVKIPIALKF
jgi:hypothetical protein